MHTSIVFLLLGVFFVSCGVDTSSSSNNTLSAIDSANVINPNPVSSNSTNATKDSNSTNVIKDSNSSNVSNCNENTIYDCNNAILDQNSCSAGTYKIAQDASYNGTNPAENGSDFFNINGEGLAIRSEHLEGSAANSAKTWVTLFYKSFPSSSNLGSQGYTSYLLAGFFQITYDIAWSDTSIPNVDRTMYVKTNQGVKPACYRLILNNVDGTLINAQKVYR